MASCLVAGVSTCLVAWCGLAHVSAILVVEGNLLACGVRSRCFGCWRQLLCHGFCKR